MIRRLRPILYPFFIIILLLFIGVVGFMFIEGYEPLEAMYMTVITISTVGFSELRPLSHDGRLFTMFLILSSFGTFAFAVTGFAKYLIDGEFRKLLLNIRVDRTIKKLKNHTIVCGYGRNGKQAYQTLTENGEKCVVVEKDRTIVTQLGDVEKVTHVEGDATQDEVLLRAGIKNARALITALPNDAENLFVVLTARVINPSIRIISRASEDNSGTKLHHAGVDSVIMPDKVGGAHMALLVVKPDVVEFIDMLTGITSSETQIEEIPCGALPGSYVGKAILELNVRKNWGASIVGYKTAEGQYIFNPPPDTLIIPNSKLFVMGTTKQIAAMKSAIIT